MYYFFIDGVLLPVTPSKLSIKIKNQNSTVNLADGSEYNILKLPGLSEVSFDCLLPNVDYPFSVYESGFLSAEYFISLFELLKTRGKSFLFCVERGVYGRTAMVCTLEEYTVTDSTDEGFDYAVSVKLKQYTERKTAVVTAAAEDGSAVVVQAQRSIGSEPANIDHTVVSGDTLWGIAKRHYGDGTKWRDIYSDNAQVIEAAAKAHGRASSSDGWWIYPGTVLRLKNAVC